MGGPYFTDYPERSALTKGTAPDPIPRKSGGPGKGREGTYTHPKSGARRRIVTPVGRRVKTSMMET